MRVDLMTMGTKLREVGELAKDAAAAGFSGLVITEAGRTAYLSCAAAALAADIDILTGIAVAFPRSPMITASLAWELAEASGGRFRLGIGTQVRAHIERRYSAEFDPPGPRLREYVEAVRHIFKAFRGDEKLDFHGRYWQMSLLPATWSPGPIDVPDPPVDIAAVNPWMLRMAGEVADGVHVHPLNTPTYLAETVRPSVEEGAKAAGRDPSDVQLIVPVFVAPGDTEEERNPWWERARFQVAFYGSTPNYGFIFDQLGREGTTPRIREKQKAGDLAGMAAVIDDDLLSHFCVASPWDDLSDRLIARLDGVADRAVSYFTAAGWQQAPASLARWGEVARDVVSRTGTGS
jgi:probable F420-dependent oxidoreductase